MLHAFLTRNRDQLIERCRAKVAARAAPRATPTELEFGVPLFLDQLIGALRAEELSDTDRSLEISGTSGSTLPAASEVGSGATRHGRELFRRGYTVLQVIHDYGDVCQAVTDLAFEEDRTFRIEEFATLNRCLDNAMAGAVTEFAHQQELRVAAAGAPEPVEGPGVQGLQLRNLAEQALLALSAIKQRNIGLNGATGAVLERSLLGIRDLMNRSLADDRPAQGPPAGVS